MALCAEADQKLSGRLFSGLGGMLGDEHDGAHRSGGGRWL